jgi:hypothetical protein
MDATVRIQRVNSGVEWLSTAPLACGPAFRGSSGITDSGLRKGIPMPDPDLTSFSPPISRRARHTCQSAGHRQQEDLSWNP